MIQPTLSLEKIFQVLKYFPQARHVYLNSMDIDSTNADMDQFIHNLQDHTKIDQLTLGDDLTHIDSSANAHAHGYPHSGNGGCLDLIASLMHFTRLHTLSLDFSLVDRAVSVVSAARRDGVDVHEVSDSFALVYFSHVIFLLPTLA